MLNFKFRLKKGEDIIMQEAAIENIYERASNFKTKDSIINRFARLSFYKLKRHYLFHSIKKVASEIDYSNFIEKKRNVCNGEEVIKGTRIRPITVYNYYLANFDRYDDLDVYFEDIKKAYPALDDEKTLYALLYCLRKMSLKQFMK